MRDNVRRKPKCGSLNTPDSPIRTDCIAIKIRTVVIIRYHLAVSKYSMVVFIKING